MLLVLLNANKKQKYLNQFYGGKQVKENINPRWRKFTRKIKT